MNESLSLGSWLITLMLSVLLGSGLYLIYVSADHYLRKQFWPINRVVVVGTYQHAHLSSLKSILKQNIRGDLLSLSLYSLGQSIKAIPWVDTVQLMRKMPDTLVVSIHERKPVAYWNKHAYMDQNGDVFSDMSFAHQAKWVNLYGPSSESQSVLDHYLLFQKLLAPLSLRIVELGVGERLSWKLRTGAGMQLVLGQKDTVDKISRFVSAYPYLIKNNKNNPIVRIDLRYPHGLAVRFVKDRV